MRGTGRGVVVLLPDAHVGGKAKVVVQDAKAYQPLLDRLETADAEKILRERLASLDAGEPGVSAEEVLSDIRHRLRIKQG